VLTKKIGVRNLRGFYGLAKIDIKPITILVGKNSSGKSTFARLFPLIRQSVEVSTKGAMLWFGQFVDFGSFTNSISKGSNTEEMILEFDIDLNQRGDDGLLPTRRAGSNRYLFADDAQVIATVYLKYDQKNNKTYTSKLELIIFDNFVSVAYDSYGWLTELVINGEEVKHRENIKGFSGSGRIIPTFNLFKAKSEPEGNVSYTHDSFYYRRRTVSYIRSRSHGGLADDTIMSVFNSIDLNYDSEILKQLKKLNLSSSYLTAYFNRLKNDSYDFNLFKQYMLLCNLSQLTDSLNHAIATDFSSVKYIKPLRATAQRYYRHQELDVDEIDSEGANIAMYLESITSGQRVALNAWLKSNIGLEVFPKQEGGHIELTLRDSNTDKEFNLADMGFGYSQVLPIFLQLWMMDNNKKSRSVLGVDTGFSTVVIEQPELHLHPEMQAKLGDVFAGLFGNPSSNRIIVETHSPHIINRLGQLVADKKISSDAIGLYLFETDSEGRSSVTEATFTDDGYLANWPFGFFEPQ